MIGELKEIMAEVLANAPEATEPPPAKSIGAAIHALARQMGQRYARCTLSNFVASQKPQEAAVATLRHHIWSPVVPGSIVLYGPSGAGKDHLLAGAAMSIVDRCSVEWINGSDLFAALRGVFGHGQDAENRLLRRFTAPDVLVISDPVPPSGDVRGWAIEFLYRIIDHRYRDFRPTWVSLNVKSFDDAVSLLSAPIVDRLRDGALVIHCDWPSYRRANHADD